MEESAHSPRIAGVGIGTFILIFGFLSCVILCFISSIFKQRRTSILTIPLTCYLITVIYLFSAEKVNPEEDVSQWQERFTSFLIIYKSF
jgi:MFS-type transporter involved in bile tolerance (Atg22 family)